MMKEEVDLVIDYPANIASLLISNQIDIGLIPVAVIPLLKAPHIISDYCIGCDGEVASVCLFSEVPLQDIETILLDYQSRTSVQLLKILVKEHWKISPRLTAAYNNYEKDISGTTAGLVIGDRALKQRLQSKYIYDLGMAWKEMTGLAFVFAAWVSNKELSERFITDFNEANHEGFKHMEEIIAKNGHEGIELKRYYSENIDFVFSEALKKGLDLFMQKLHLL